MSFVALLGSAAALCSAVSYAPQVLHLMRCKSAKDISFISCLLLVTGGSLWTVYGLLKGDYFLVASSSVAFAFASGVLVLKWTYDKTPHMSTTPKRPTRKKQES